MRIKMMPKTKRTDNFQGGLEILSMVFTHMHTDTYTGTHTCTNPTQRKRERERESRRRDGKGGGGGIWGDQEVLSYEILDVSKESCVLFCFVFSKYDEGQFEDVKLRTSCVSSPNLLVQTNIF